MILVQLNVHQILCKGSLSVHAARIALVDPLVRHGILCADTKPVEEATPGGDTVGEGAPPPERVIKRRDPLAEHVAKDEMVEEEKAAGRMGGGAGRGIVYDEAGLERLLDRSQLEAEGANGVLFGSCARCFIIVSCILF